jgi:hypothetical protein
LFWFLVEKSIIEKRLKDNNKVLSFFRTIHKIVYFYVTTYNKFNTRAINSIRALSILFKNCEKFPERATAQIFYPFSWMSLADHMSVREYEVSYQQGDGEEVV